MRINVQDASAWTEKTKLNITDLDEELLGNIETEVLAKIGVSYDTSTWLDPDTTPRIVRVVISKMYVSWYYDRQYSEDAEANVYATRLQNNADDLIKGLIEGTINIPEVPTNTTGQPSFYPNDVSSAQTPTSYDPSLGPAAFSMGMVF